MSGNSFGKILQLTTFGESHCYAMGGIIDGFPAGVTVDLDWVRRDLQRRRPGQSALTTTRNETDEVELLSGVFENISLGTPIGFILRNNDQRSQDYSALKNIYRPGHADFVYDQKYGHRDYRGGGRASARETVSRVVGGAFAKMLLRDLGIHVRAYVQRIGEIEIPSDASWIPGEENDVRCPHEATASRMRELILHCKEIGDSVGGSIRLEAHGVPAGFGNPVFDKLNAQLAHAMFSIPSVKAFEMGDGIASTYRFGSANNDAPLLPGSTNHDGGIQGGISNGKNISCTISFKPVSTIAKNQKTANSAGEEIEFSATGRHDPCVLPRAVVVVEAMAALVLADSYLLSLSDQWKIKTTT